MLTCPLAAVQSHFPPILGQAKEGSHFKDLTLPACWERELAKRDGTPTPPGSCSVLPTERETTREKQEEGTRLENALQRTTGPLTVQTSLRPLQETATAPPAHHRSKSRVTWPSSGSQREPSAGLPGQRGRTATRDSASACADGGASRRGARCLGARLGVMGPSRVQAVFLDLDNTLIDTAGASRKGMSEVTSCPAAPLRRRRSRSPAALTPPPASRCRRLARAGSFRGAPAARPRGLQHSPLAGRGVERVGQGLPAWDAAFAPHGGSGGWFGKSVPAL
ncbi:hypothetical protein J0S82_019428 [Galemys pyrenaicus]|uniref:Uncharacterized protein n=1 Tax=Galemys pyrenaicus TaxID=202257 RepID=A0A8J6DVM7_GALPY|nr:hypothetical protein J0S82_019428 [Galemys pyrenaicus]